MFINITRILLLVLLSPKNGLFLAGGRWPAPATHFFKLFEAVSKKIRAARSLSKLSVRPFRAEYLGDIGTDWRPLPGGRRPRWSPKLAGSRRPAGRISASPAA